MSGSMESSAAELHCAVCREPLDFEIGGVCQACLLNLPDETFWEPEALPTAEDLSKALPRFEIRHELGRGALGIVYSAIDRQLGRAVAIKAMLASANNPEFSARFVREANAMAALNHPRIVTIYESGVVDELHFIVMELLPGGNLAENLKKHRYTHPEAIRILSEVCQALTQAHRRGVTHRDIKPSNILLDDQGHAKLSDFGLARGTASSDLESATRLTKSGMTLGTPFYMAPEQIDCPTRADHRADIYSAAAVFHEMVTGEPPKPQQEADAKFRKIPRRFKRALVRALPPRPEQRHASAHDFSRDIEQSLLRPKTLRHRFLYASAALTLIGLTFVTAQLTGSPDTPYRQYISEADLSGLPIGTLEEEIDLREWRPLAQFDFKKAQGDSAHKQRPLQLVEGAEIENGHLILTGEEPQVRAKLKRRHPETLTGLLLNYRFQPSAYLAAGKRNRVVVDFGLSDKIGVFLVSQRWGDPNPTLALGTYQPLAPPGVFEPHFEKGQWHDVWIAIGDGYRVWIDGQPIYRSPETELAIHAWRYWHGDAVAHLGFESMQGRIDHVKLWEKF